MLPCMAGPDPAVAVAQPPELLAEVPWPTRREALRAALIVACVVGVPSVAAVGAVLVLFALSAAVLLAPLVAAALAVAAWWGCRAPLRAQRGRR